MNQRRLFRNCGWVLLACTCLLTLTVWILACLHTMFGQINPFNGVIVDGTFQLLNPLRRIDAGQRGGVDFQYFHGLGIPYFHYPIYKLFGTGLHASELSRYLVALMTFIGGYIVVFGIVTRRVIPTIFLTTLAILLGEETWANALAQPGNSLMGVRSFTPLLILALLLHGTPGYRGYLALGGFLGIAFLLSVEHGIAAFLATSLCGGIVICLTGIPRSRLFKMGLLLGVSITTIGCGLIAIGGITGAIQSLRYNLIIVPADQFWYFGVPPNAFLKSWAEIPHQYQLLQLMGVSFLIGIQALVGLIRSGGQSRLALGLMWANIYALITCIAMLGYIDNSYLNVISRIVLISILTTVWHFYPEIQNRFSVPIPALLIALLLFKLGMGVSRTGPSRLSDLPALAKSVRLHFRMQNLPQLKFLAPQHQQQLDEFLNAIQSDPSRVHEHPIIWSTYSGLLEAHLNTFHPDTDYLIHVLGPVARQAYVSKFEQVQPDYVVTVRNSYYGHEEWLRHGSWEFYERLLRNYSAYRIGTHQILWKRTSTPWNRPEEFTQTVPIPDDGRSSFSLPLPPNLPADAICVVHVEYTTQCDFRSIPVIGKLPRYFIIPSDARTRLPVSLPPHQKEWTFHLVPEPGKVPQLRTEVQSLVGGELQLLRVRFRILRLGSNAPAFHS